MGVHVLAPLIIVVGPTGAGKSDLSLRIAKAFPCEIVNCDSLQVYRHFNIGAAKLNLDQRGGIPHHLIDIIEPAEVFTAGDYAERGRAVLRQISARERIPLVVGGTGFYLRALLEGLSPGPPRDEAIRAVLRRREQRRPGSLHRILNRLDPLAAGRIHAKDVNKTMRALEVRLIEKRPISDLFSKGRDPLGGFAPIKIGLDPPRKDLYQRLDARTVKMFDQGLLDEVRQILALGISPDAKPFDSLGYRQAFEVVEGRLSVEQAILSAQLETRRYAKRQMTWFRRERDVRWFIGFGDDSSLQHEAVMFIGSYLGPAKVNSVTSLID